MPYFCGRGDRIRTCGLMVPNHARYQTALRPVSLQSHIIRSIDIIVNNAISEKHYKKRRINEIREGFCQTESNKSLTEKHLEKMEVIC